VLVPTASIANLAQLLHRELDGITGGTTTRCRWRRILSSWPRVRKDVLLSEDFATLTDAAVRRLDHQRRVRSGLRQLALFGLAVPSYKFKATASGCRVRPSPPARRTSSSGRSATAAERPHDRGFRFGQQRLDLIDTVALRSAAPPIKWPCRANDPAQVLVHQERLQLRLGRRGGQRYRRPVGGSSVVIDQTVAALTYGATGLVRKRLLRSRPRQGGTWSDVVSATTPRKAAPLPLPNRSSSAMAGRRRLVHVGADSLDARRHVPVAVHDQPDGAAPTWLRGATTNGTGLDVTWTTRIRSMAALLPHYQALEGVNEGGPKGPAFSSGAAVVFCRAGLHWLFAELNLGQIMDRIRGGAS
jgi:hypothetical protein